MSIEKLYKKYNKKMILKAQSILRCEKLVEDVLHEVFIKIYEKEIHLELREKSACSRAAMSRLRTQSAAESLMFTAWAGVEPQQFQSGMATRFISSARHTAWVDCS